MKVNNINFSQKIANFIENSQKTQKILQKVDKNPALFNAAYTAILATTIKPVSILAIALKTPEGKEDAKYASAKSVATGILDFLIALTIFIPLNKKLNKVSGDLFKKVNTVYFKDKELCSNYKSVMNRAIKIASLPLFSFLKFSAIEPFVKVMFGRGNKRENNENIHK